MRQATDAKLSGSLLEIAVQRGINSQAHTLLFGVQTELWYVSKGLSRYSLGSGYLPQKSTHLGFAKY